VREKGVVGARAHPHRLFPLWLDVQGTAALVLSSSISLEELHELSALGHARPEGVLASLQAAAGSDGLVSRDEFHGVMTHFLGAQSTNTRARSQDILNRVFDALDVNGDGAVDEAELRVRAGYCIVGCVYLLVCLFGW